MKKFSMKAYYTVLHLAKCVPIMLTTIPQASPLFGQNSSQTSYDTSTTQCAVVMWVVLGIWLVISLYLLIIDRKITKLEKSKKND